MGRKKAEKLSAIHQDYLEAIYEIMIIEKEIAAKVTDISEKLKVNKSNVSNMMKVLSEKKLINYNTYRWITLTEKGYKEAEKIYMRHKELHFFFHEVLGLDKSISEKNACRIEHAIDCETMTRLKQFCKFIKKNDHLKYDSKKKNFSCFCEK